MQRFASPVRLAVLSLALLGGVPTAAWAQSESLRPEVLRPLLTSQELNQQKKPREALAKLAEVDTVGNFNALETFTLERLRATVMLALDDPRGAAQALTKALTSERGSSADRLALMENLAVLQYRLKAYAEAAHWAGQYLTQGGTRDALQVVQAQALYLSGQPGPAVSILEQRLAKDEAAQRAPDETQLRVLASAYQQLKDDGRYVATLERLVRHYPSPEIWTDLLYRVLKRSDLSAPLEIDVHRLMRSVGASTQAGDRLEHAQLAITAGYPGEAKQVLEEAQTAQLLHTPADQQKAQALLAQATRMQAEDNKLLPQLDAQLAKAKDGNPLFNNGLNFVLNGQHTRGTALLQQGVDKGGLKQPDAAQLRWGYALFLAGQKEAARQTFSKLSGTGIEAYLAKLWLLHLGHQSG